MKTIIFPVVLTFMPISLFAQDVESENNQDSTLVIHADYYSFEIEEDGFQLNFQEYTTDLYLKVTANALRSSGFRIRGYQQRNLKVYLNSLIMNDLETSNVIWNQWGGLSEMFFNTEQTLGLNANQYGFGGLTGTLVRNVSPIKEKAQTKISLGGQTTVFQNSISVAHHSGLNKKGWAFSALFSKRWSGENYIPGSFDNAMSYSLGISKKWNAKHSLELISYGSFVERGKASSTTLESKELTNNVFYNPNWGFQNGKKRNAQIYKSFLPTVLLTYNFQQKPNSNLEISALYQTGFIGNSGLDWYNTPDPRPDYYKYMPSFYQLNPDGIDEDAAQRIEDLWKNNPETAQIDWQRMYDANRSNFETINDVSGKRSLYILGEDKSEIMNYQLGLRLNKKISKRWTIQSGLNIRFSESVHFKELKDLLGGDFYVNWNQFAERAFIGNPDFKQNNLIHPDGIIREGDQYNYHYKSIFYDLKWWTQAQASFGKFNAFVAYEIGMHAFQRNGKYQNGLFPNDSYGKSEMKSFFPYQIKGGLIYVINPKNSLFLNGWLGKESPIFYHVFVSPKTRNSSIQNLKMEQNRSYEIGYIFQNKLLDVQLTWFTTEQINRVEAIRYYDESYRSFINFMMQGIDTRNLGAEMSMDLKITPYFSLSLMSTWMQIFYTSTPSIDVYRDNDVQSLVLKDTVFWKNYYSQSGSQSAYYLGLNYHGKFGFTRINLNYFERSFIGMNPSRLTKKAVDLVSAGSSQWHQITDQETLPSYFKVDLVFGRTFDLPNTKKWLPKDSRLSIYLGIYNVLNHQHILYGNQQMRFDYASSNPERFPNKYTYGYGRNYSLGLKFQF